MKSIPGVMRYDLLAQQHRLDDNGVVLAVRELARQRLKVRDIAQALRLTVPAVLAMLKETK